MGLQKWVNSSSLIAAAMFRKKARLKFFARVLGFWEQARRENLRHKKSRPGPLAFQSTLPVRRRSHLVGESWLIVAFHKPKERS